MTQWQPIATAPDDGAFRLYGLHVKNMRGFKWFEVHYVSRDDDGEMIHPSGDAFTEWGFADFEVWADAPQPLRADGEHVQDRKEG